MWLIYLSVAAISVFETIWTERHWQFFYSILLQKQKAWWRRLSKLLSANVLLVTPALTLYALANETGLKAAGVAMITVSAWNWFLVFYEAPTKKHSLKYGWVSWLMSWVHILYTPCYFAYLALADLELIR